MLNVRTGLRICAFLLEVLAGHCCSMWFSDKEHGQYIGDWKKRKITPDPDNLNLNSNKIPV